MSNYIKLLKRYLVEVEEPKVAFALNFLAKARLVITSDSQQTT